MKSYEEFTHFAASRLNSDLELLQTLREKLVRKLILLRSALVLMFVGFLGLMFSFDLFMSDLEDNTFYLVSAVLFVILYISLFFFIFAKQRKLRAEFVHLFKSKLINSIVDFFDLGLKYEPSKFISLDDFRRSGLVKNNIKKYYGDDLVEGKVGKTKIRFSEVHAFIEQSSQDNKKHYVEVFGGIFFIGDFNKNFNGTTYVMPDKIEKFMGRFAKYIQSFIKVHGQLVKMEDIDFENQFTVYSDDQIEARYILSTSLMQRILDFKKKAGSDIMMAFKDSRIYMAIPKQGLLFEPKIFGKLIAEETLRKYYEDMAIAISSVEELNLNLRIWGKE
ncbi:MAG: DUF3137 domain-containing protein [Candidatus Kapaibacterium sp.]